MNIFKFLFAFLLIMTYGQASYAGPAQAKEWKKVVKMYVEAVDGSGKISASGFPISKSDFMTAGHFCSAAIDGMSRGLLKESVSFEYMNANNEMVTFDGGDIIKFEFSETQDLCIIRRPKHGIVPVKFAKEMPKFGEKVFAVGYPRGVGPLITEGYVGQPISEGLPDEVLNDKILISTPVTFGNSGGAIFNLKGELVGVCVMVHPEYSHLAFAITLENIIDFIHE